MLEANFSAGEELFAVVGPEIQKHICMGSFEAEEKISYVITPFGKVSTLNEETIFKTFDEAKVYLSGLGEATLKVATDQLEKINTMSESDVVEIQNTAPTEEEMKADEKVIAEKAAK